MICHPISAPIFNEIVENMKSAAIQGPEVLSEYSLFYRNDSGALSGEYECQIINKTLF